MKFPILLFFSLTCLSLQSQDKLTDILPFENERVVYSEVISIDNTSKIDLYNRAKEWITINYKSINDVIQLDDEENIYIIGKGVIKIPYYTSPNIDHTILLEFKEGFYKYSISQFHYYDSQNNAFNIENFPRRWTGRKKLYRVLNEKVQNLITSLKASMQE